MAKAKKKTTHTHSVSKKVVKTYLSADITAMAQPDPIIIIREIKNAVRRLNRVFKNYEDIGAGLETQIQLNLSTDCAKLNYTLNPQWSASLKKMVEKVIIESAAKCPQLHISQG